MRYHWSPLNDALGHLNGHQNGSENTPETPCDDWSTRDLSKL